MTKYHDRAGKEASWSQEEVMVKVTAYGSMACPKGKRHHPTARRGAIGVYERETPI